MSSFYNGSSSINNEDLLVDDNDVELVAPGVVFDETSDITKRITTTIGYIDALESPIEAIDTLRGTISDGNYSGAIEASKAVDSVYEVVQESLKLKPLTIKNLDMMSIRAHLVAMEGFMGEVGEKIKAFFKWCIDKITALGTMIKGWFSSKGDDVIKASISTVRNKRLLQYDVKGTIYTYDGDKALSSSVQLASSASKVVELFRRYSDYVNQINTHLNELISDEGKLKEGDDQKAVVDTFINAINKVVSDKKVNDTYLGFTFKLASEATKPNLYNKVILVLKGQKADKSEKPSESSDAPVYADYKMSITGRDIETTFNHFVEAQKVAKEYAEGLDKLSGRIKSLSSAIESKGDSEDGAKLYKSIRVALEVIGDCIKNIGTASINLANAKKYWCVTVVSALASSTESGAAEKPKDPAKDDNKQ